MSSITTINSSDGISASRTVINTNFSNLNTDKMETSVLDTDTTLSANSDAKVPTQKAVKSYVDAVASPTGKSWNEYAASSNGTDSYAITLTGVSAYVVGQVYKFRADVANTGSASVNVNGLGAKTIKKSVSSDLATGDIVAGQVVICIYDISGNMQMISNVPTPSPTQYILNTVSSAIGDATTQFDITNPAGTTFRYTWDTTGTNPSISLVNFPIGSLVEIKTINFNANNNGVFVITGAGSNYFEVTNAAGVAENDKTIGTNGTIRKSGTGTYVKPSNLKYITIEMIGGGASGGGASSSREGASGGGAGAYLRKQIPAASLAATEYYLIGYAGAGVSAANGLDGGTTMFSSTLKCTGGIKGIRSGSVDGGAGGTATGGDINIDGGRGQPCQQAFYSSTGSSNGDGGAGGNSQLGQGGAKTYAGAGANGWTSVGYGSGGGGAAAANGGGAVSGGTGTQGVIILTEYYV